MNILRYALRRVLYAIPIVLGVLFLLFVVFFNIADPYDMARMAKGEKAPPDVLDAWLELNQWRSRVLRRWIVSGSTKRSTT